jgi:hypothetical protein
MDRKEIKRTPLLMMPDGSFIRVSDHIEGAVVVEEPPLYEKPPAVEDQTAAVLGQDE